MSTKAFLLSAVPVLSSVLAATSIAEATLTSCVVTATNFTNSGFTLTRYNVYARFDGVTDTLLACSNFCGIGFPCGNGTGDLYGGFWHKDNASYNSGVLMQAYGTWNPTQTGSTNTNRPYDSFLTIGGLPTGTNTTQATPDWTSGGSGIHAGNARSWNRADIVDNCLVGWFNSNPANLQGRVGVGANTATDVMIGQFILLATDPARTYQLTFAYNDGSAGASTLFQTCQFEIGLCPTPGALALFGLAGLARRRRR